MMYHMQETTPTLGMSRQSRSRSDPPTRTLRVGDLSWSGRRGQLVLHGRVSLYTEHRHSHEDSALRATTRQTRQSQKTTTDVLAAVKPVTTPLSPRSVTYIARSSTASPTLRSPRRAPAHHRQQEVALLHSLLQTLEVVEPSRSPFGSIKSDLDSNAPSATSRTPLPSHYALFSFAFAASFALPADPGLSSKTVGFPPRRSNVF